MKSGPALLRVGIAGLGSVGRRVARALDEGLPGLVLSAIASRDLDRARASVKLRQPPRFVPVDALAAHCDVVVECAPAAALPAIATPVLEAGRTLLVLSGGALLDHPELIDLAALRGARIVVPTGATLGLDAVAAAAEGTLRSVKMVMRKPVGTLVGAAYLVEHGIRVDHIVEPLCVYSGSVRGAVAGFAANLNVAMALSLAGIGPDRTQLEVWADPQAERNLHRIEVVGEEASFSMEIHNQPSENPRTSLLTALSAIAALRKLTATLVVGT